MAAKDWLVPLVVGSLGFGAMLALAEPAAHEADGPRFTFPFRTVAVVGATPEGFHLLATLDPLLEASMDCPMAVGSGARALIVDDVHVQATCAGPGLAVFDVADWTTLTLSDAGLRGDVLDLTQAAPGPRLGIAGYNATRVTVHVFDGDGELIASNGNASEQARLMRTYSAEQLPKGTWYLGANATAPPGTQAPPRMAAAFLSQARPLLQGLPIGGVATTQTDALAGLYGRLWVTLQVDELVYAP